MKLGFILDEKGKFISDYLVPAKDMTKSFQEAEFDDDVFYPDKVQGYKITYLNGVPHASFNENLWKQYQNSLKTDSKKQEAKMIFNELAESYTLSMASDEDAYKMRYLYDEWDPDGVKYKKDDRLMYKDKFYKVLKTHKSQADSTPDTDTSLYVEIVESIQSIESEEVINDDDQQ